MPTLDEVNEALDHARAVPSDQRGDGWHAYVNALLSQRETALLEQTFKEPALAGKSTEGRP